MRVGRERRQVALTVSAAAIVDSRNIFHQAGDATGERGLPSVVGVRTALARYGFDVSAVHVGLALARPSDQQSLTRQHADNDAYRRQIISAGGDVLLGELHRKPSGTVEEKMVDCACCVRITRYADEIIYGRTNIEAIVVLSKDIDLRPAVDYAIEMDVPIVVAAHDVVQHRGHPFLLLGPHAYAELTGATRTATGHELRELLVCALYDGKPLTWTVSGTPSRPTLVHDCGLLAVPGGSVTLPHSGATVSLRLVDVTWQPDLLGSFPVPVCDTSPRRPKTWSTAVVQRRTAPMTLEVRRQDGSLARLPFPLGGVVPGETVLTQATTGRIIGRLPSGQQRTFDPDTPHVLRVISALPKGGAIVADSGGMRGLLATNQALVAGERVPGVQVDQKARGPVWAAIGTPLPALPQHAKGAVRDRPFVKTGLRSRTEYIVSVPSPKTMSTTPAHY